MTPLRFFILLLSAYFAALFQSAVIGEIFPDLIKPDLMLIFIVYLGFMAPPIAGAALTLFCGLLYDSYSGSPFGLFMFSDLAVFFLLKLLAKFLILGEALSLRLILVILAAVTQAFLLIFLPFALEISESFDLPTMNEFVAPILMTCLVGWPLFHLFKKLDPLPKPESSGEIS